MRWDVEKFVTVNLAWPRAKLSDAAFGDFLDGFICLVIRFSRDGAIHFVFMDWRHMRVLLNAADRTRGAGPLPHQCP